MPLVPPARVLRNPLFKNLLLRYIRVIRADLVVGESIVVFVHIPIACQVYRFINVVINVQNIWRNCRVVAFGVPRARSPQRSVFLRRGVIGVAFGQRNYREGVIRAF